MDYVLEGEPPIPVGFMRLRSQGDETNYWDVPKPTPINLTEEDKEYLRKLGIEI